MRKALLVIALLAASFAGGAAANSPAMAKLKKLLGVVSAELTDEEAAPEVSDAPETDAFPTAPPPWAKPAEAVEAEEAPTPSPPPATPDPAITAAVAPVASAGPQPASPAPAAEVPAPPAPTSPGPGLPKLEPTPPADPPEAKAAPAAKAAPDWSDAPDSAAPAAAVVPGRPEAPTATAPVMRVDPAVAPTAATASSPSVAPQSGWPELRRRMKELGVTRYRVEAEPDGAARFSCVIPLAGERAVAQHFEAEADDELKAADAALRRVALWRAAQRR